MTPTQSTDDNQGTARDGPLPEILARISDQLDALADRVGNDIDANAKNQDTSGFLLYYLTDAAGEPLKSTQAEAAGIDANDIEMTGGYSHLDSQCKERSANLRLDQHYYSDDPKPTTIYRVIVDGWT